MTKLPYANENIELSPHERNEMIRRAADAYAAYLDALRIDWRNDPNSQDTPVRVAKAFVNDLARGCYEPAPKITVFDNINHYSGVVFQGDIDVKSLCSHHHLAFTGKAYVAYIPDANGKVIGLSKLNRIVEWFARRPQVQENLTQQVHQYVDETCEDNNGVAVMIKAQHTCCSHRGVGHDSTMITSHLSGAFKTDASTREEFYKFVDTLK